MAPARKMEVGTLLVDCPAWPTMHALSEPVARRIRAIAADARTVYPQLPIFDKDVVGALVVLRAPTAPEAVFALFARHAETPEYWAARGAPVGRKNLTLKLPAPVSHRLDLLVSAAREHRDITILRRDIVGALVTGCSPTSPADTHALFMEYLEATVGVAGDGFPDAGPLISGKPLKAGRRPGPKSVRRAARSR